MFQIEDEPRPTPRIHPVDALVLLGFAAAIGVGLWLGSQLCEARAELRHLANIIESRGMR